MTGLDNVDKIGVIFTILLQSVAFVWGAAKLHSAVGSLEKTVEKLGRTMDGIADKVHEHSEDIAVLKSHAKFGRVRE